MVAVKGIGPHSGFANRPDPERVRRALEQGIQATEEQKHPGYRVTVHVELLKKPG